MLNLSAKPQGCQRPDGKGYEKRDASAPWIFGIVAFLLVSGLIMHFVLAGVMERLQKTPAPSDRWTGVRRIGETSAQIKDIPHLQVSPTEDLNIFRRREETELNTYGWIDHSNGIVRIPISHAMDLLLQRGLPVRSKTNASETGPSVMELQQQRPQYPQPEIQGAK